jgi:endonuclease YncB( thermonuclease family)
MAAFARLVLLIVIGAALLFALLQATRMSSPQAPRSVEKSNTSLASLPPSSVQIGESAKLQNQPVPPSRDVGGQLVASPLQPQETLERISPLPQPTPPPTTKPVEEKPISRERWRLVYNAVVTSAGIFQTNESALVLPGIDVISTDERCALDGGKTWPCGMVARTSLRSFINGKALTCKLPDILTEKSFIADCRLRGRDLALWLVANGWARASADGPYLDDQDKAEQSQLGIFGNPPQGVQIAAP